MWLHRRGIVAVLAGLFWALPALAEVPLTTPSLTQAARRGWLQLRVVSGRITIGGWRFGRINSNSTNSRGSESLIIGVTNGKPSLSYERSTSQEQFSVEITSGDRVRIRRSGKQDTTIVPVQFTQTPNEPTSLLLGPDGQQQVYRAASLWHLLIAQPEACRQHLIPLLELLRPGWKPAEVAAAMEAELLRAGVGELPDRREWDALVEQLADDRFSRREAADRQLRSAGPAVLGYLRGLDFNRLDAEQRFRVQRILAYFSRQSAEDTAEQFAPRLVGDPTVWLALLSRQEESTRRLAARQLAAILGKPIPFDPAADPAIRKSQIEQLRARIQGERSGAKQRGFQGP